MEVIKCWEENGVTSTEPYKRHVKVFLAPDKRDVKELTFLYVNVYPKSQSDYHKHDRLELVLVLSGRGAVICDNDKIPIEPDMILLIRPGESHQFINDGDDMLKCAALYSPAYLAKDLLKRMTDASEEVKKS
jgi:mannose-6-phosphate isomerase-like protein (cupin superfamily)